MYLYIYITDRLHAPWTFSAWITALVSKKKKVSPEGVGQKFFLEILNMDNLLKNISSKKKIF